MKARASARAAAIVAAIALSSGAGAQVQTATDSRRDSVEAALRRVRPSARLRIDAAGVTNDVHLIYGDRNTIHVYYERQRPFDIRTEDVVRIDVGRPRLIAGAVIGGATLGVVGAIFGGALTASGCETGACNQKARLAAIGAGVLGVGIGAGVGAGLGSLSIKWVRIYP